MNKFLLGTFVVFALIAVLTAKPHPQSDDDDGATPPPKVRPEPVKEEPSTATPSAVSDEPDVSDESDDDKEHVAPSGAHKTDDTDPAAALMFPFFGSFAYQRLQESLQQVQNQLDNMWNMSMNSTGLMDMPDDYSNSTSHTTVIDGNTVSVNETVKKVNEDGIQSVYHIRVITILPTNDTDPVKLSQQMAADQLADPVPTTPEPVTEDVEITTPSM